MAVWNNTLYAGGVFTYRSNMDAGYIASWNGSGWVPVGKSINNFVLALCIYKGELYAGGSFTSPKGSANYIAKWSVGKSNKKSPKASSTGGL